MSKPPALHKIMCFMGLCLFLPSAVSGQGERNLLDEAGALAAGDETLDGGEFLDRFQVEVRAGGILRVDMRSPDFDTYLFVRSPSGDQTDNDDFEGDARRSHVDVEVAESGTWTIVATSFEPGETGTYQLTVGQTAAASGSAGPGVRNERGELREGDETLQTGEFQDTYRIQGSAGQRLVATVASGDFDTYLMVRGPNDDNKENDDIEGRPGESEVVMTLGQTGEYRIIVTTFNPGETGAYTLRIEHEGAGATASGPSDDPRGASSVRTLLDESGSLVDGDLTLDAGEYIDRYKVQVDEGQTLIVDMRSSDFDTYLFVRSPSGDQTDNDDFEGDANRSRVEVAVSEAGTWLIVATSFNPGETGAYRLTATSSSGGGGDPAPLSVSGASGSATGSSTRLETGELAEGDSQLDSGEYFDTYSFEGLVGEEVVLDLRSSEMDPFLILTSPSREALQNDDFEGDATRSVISHTLTESGRYVVAATSYKPEERGRYTLRISRGEVTTATRALRTEQGTLGAEDTKLQSGEFSDTYTIQGQPGQTLVATVSSSDFDTYLLVRGPNDDDKENDDLEGRPNESEVEMRLSESGEYRVVVTSYRPGETGAYDLRIRQSAPAQTAQRQRDVSNISMGATVGGALQDGDGVLEGGELRDIYVFEGRAGERVSVALTSSDFDTYVGVVTPDGENHDNDDWEGSTSESRVELTLPATGRYRILATSYQAGESGTYELSLSEGTAVASASDGGPARVFGVFVGISDYGGRANDLAYTAADAHRMSEALQEGGGMRASDAIVLTDREATRANVERAVRDVGARAGPDDMFVFFYSGHGARVDRAGPQMTDPDAMDETLEFFDRGITDDEFSDLLSEIGPGISLLVLDACYSGGFSKDVVSVPGRMGFFSSEEDVVSSVAAKFKAGGYLAHFMADGVGKRLADSNADGAVSAIEISQYLYERYRDELNTGSDAVIRAGGREQGYQQLVVDRGSVGASQILFR